MRAEGQARLDPPRTPGSASMGYCMLAVGYVESGLVGNCECAAGNGVRGVTGCGCLHSGGGTRTTRDLLLLRRMRAALYLGCCFAPIGDALACCLLLCCCAAVPCTFTPGEQTGQRPSPLLMLMLCTCHCPQKPGRPVSPVSLGPLSCSGPPQAALGPTGSSEAGTTCRREMPGNASREA